MKHDENSPSLHRQSDSIPRSIAALSRRPQGVLLLLIAHVRPLRTFSSAVIGQAVRQPICTLETEQKLS
eukprot:SAG25_NODE_1269_length_3443_cov_1.767344_3_plen_69_part_00